MKKEIKDDNIKFNLHESTFLDYKIDGKNLILRVAINCGICDNVLGYEDNDSSYIYDIVCHNFKIKEKTPNFKESELYLWDVYGFKFKDGIYNLCLGDIYSNDCAIIVFICDLIDWVPIKLINSDDLYDDADYIKNEFSFEKSNIKE